VPQATISSPSAIAATQPANAASKLRGSLTVFAAASLTESFKTMQTTLEQANPGLKITYNFAGSPTLRAQLAQGAKADVFASADEPNMQGAQQDGTIADQPRVFAQNRLVVILPAANPAGITQLQDLAKPGAKLVLAQQDVPVGRYSRDSLNKMSASSAFGAGFSVKVLANIKSEEANVKDVVAKVQLGEADGGFVYKTDVTASVRSAVKMLDIPDQFNVIARYPVAAVKGAPNEAGAHAFIDYLLSPAGQAVLATYGFSPPAESGAASARTPLQDSGVVSNVPEPARYPTKD
jgi:molybdate transport system substrate-binding protein